MILNGQPGFIPIKKCRTASIERIKQRKFRIGHKKPLGFPRGFRCKGNWIQFRFAKLVQNLGCSSTKTLSDLRVMSPTSYLLLYPAMKIQITYLAINLWVINPTINLDGKDTKDFNVFKRYLKLILTINHKYFLSRKLFFIFKL